MTDEEFRKLVELLEGALGMPDLQWVPAACLAEMGYTVGVDMAAEEIAELERLGKL